MDAKNDQDSYIKLYNRIADEFGEAIDILEKTGKVRPKPIVLKIESIGSTSYHRDYETDAANDKLFGRDHESF